MTKPPRAAGGDEMAQLSKRLRITRDDRLINATGVIEVNPRKT
jgi:hypothetical protein